MRYIKLNPFSKRQTKKKNMPFQQIYGFGAYQMKRKNDSKPETKVKHLSGHKTRKQINILKRKFNLCYFCCYPGQSDKWRRIG